MIEYSLLLSDGTSYQINSSASTASIRKAIVLSGGSTSRKSLIVERTYGDGSIKVGSDRGESARISVSIPFAFADDTTFDAYLNALASALARAEYLVNETASTRTPISFETLSVEFDEGCYKRSGEATVSLVQLVPYWEDETATTVSESLTSYGTATFSVNNTGVAPALWNLEVTNAEQDHETLFELSIDTGNGATSFSGLSMVGASYPTVEVSLDGGTARAISSDEETEVDLMPLLVSGSGLEAIPVGSQTVTVYMTFTGTVSLSYRKRYVA